MLFDALDRVDTEKIVSYVKARQNEDGSFGGDQYSKFSLKTFFSSTLDPHYLEILSSQDLLVCRFLKLGRILDEIDTRFSFCAVACLSLLVSSILECSISQICIIPTVFICNLRGD